jgi:integrase
VGGPTSYSKITVPDVRKNFLAIEIIGQAAEQSLHQLYSRLHPISSVRQSAVRERDPDTLTIKEMEATIAAIGPQVIRVMVMVAVTTAIRRSELRGLRWADVFEGLKLSLRRGLFRKKETSMKTKASRKPVPILPELVEVLLQWRTETSYPADTDWVSRVPSPRANARTGLSRQ